MKKILTTALSVLFVALLYAQDTLNIYFDAAWKETSRDKAEYSRKKFRSGSKWGVMDYYKSGKIQMTGTYLNDSCTVDDGVFTWYDEKGVINRTCNYRDGKTDGLEIQFYENGKKRTEGNFKAGKLEGDWVGYYKSGRIAARVLYADNEQTSGKFFNEDGTTNKDIKTFFRAAEYPGGNTAFGRYLYHALIYPDSAQKKGIEGSVMVQFMVRKDGVVTDIKVVKSVEHSLDMEALRVIREMPSWTPAVNGGVYSDFYLRQPVTFKLK